MNGNKTYAVAALMVLHALSAYALGHDQALNLQEILAALGLSALRAGVKKAERPESLPPGLRSMLFAAVICSGGLATAAETVSVSVSEPVSGNSPTHPLTRSPAYSTSKLYFDSFISARTPNFRDATYSYGLGIGYQVSPYWSADIRASHSGFDTRGSVVQELGGRLVARMPFEFLAPYTFLGASFDLERDRWLLRPGAGIEFGVNKRLRGLSLFAEGGLDADLHGRNGYVFNGGVRLRF
jgi:hypothetical protein